MLLVRIQEATPHKAAVEWPLTCFSQTIKGRRKNMRRSKDELINVVFSIDPLHMDAPGLTDQQELPYVASLGTLDVVWRICWERWMIGTDGERESRKSVLDDDNDDDIV